MVIPRLEHVLKFGHPNHSSMILKSKNLKEAHIYCKMHNVNGIVTGQAIELYIKNQFNMLKNSSSNCCGDLRKNDINYEIKVSNGGKFHNNFNFVQIRLNHNCEYILTAYHLSEENLSQDGVLYIFHINKPEIKKMIYEHGSYSHGTVSKNGQITMESLNDETNSKEYSLRPKFGDRCWIKMLKYRILDLKEL